MFTDDHKWKSMCANKLSKGGLMWVHVSSIVKWGYQDNFKTV